MNLEKELHNRSESKCELCGSTKELNIFEVSPVSKTDLSNSLLACSNCSDQLNDLDIIQPNHWRCLNESMWSEHPPVQVIAWRMLNHLKNENWTQDLLDMLYLEEETLKWAKKDITEAEEVDQEIKHIDINGVQLEAGDSVVLVKDLNVKGGNFTAKRGTHVRNISLDRDNAEYIEGRVNGQHIVILTKYVKKS